MFGRRLALVCLAIAAGCQAARPVAPVDATNRAAGSTTFRVSSIADQSGRGGEWERGRFPTSPTLPLAPSPTRTATRLVGFQRDRPQPIALDEPFAGQSELKLPQLLAEIQMRNQTLAAMRAASLAAAEQYSQARALDDPLLTSMIAPASLNSGIANLPGNSAGYIIGGAQKLPLFGKRELRGQAALAESRAAHWDVDDARLAIVEATALAYYDYFLVRQQMALNVQNTTKLREFHEIAARKYESNLVPQQDVLQAEVELAELARRQIELERAQRIAAATINTLMHRAPDAWLPAPPAYLDASPVRVSATQLRAMALTRRPDLASLSAKIQAEQVRLRLAEKEFLPDLELFGRYDNFWSQPSLRGQVGVNMNVPLYRDKRYAAVREAQYRLSQRRAEYQQRMDDINREVQTAFERFDEAQRTVAIYTNQILPAAGKNVDSAFAAYESGRGDFLRLIAAQRQLIVVQERYQQSIADYHRRRVELERVVGEPLLPP